MRKEGGHNGLILKDIEEKVFHLLVHWLYTQRLDVADGEAKALILFTKLWLMADRFMMPALQNATIDRIAKLLSTANGKSTKKFLEVSL